MQRWPINTAYFWQEAPFFRLLLPLVLAIISYDRGWLPPQDANLWCIGALTSFLVLHVLRKPNKAFRYLLFFSLQFALFCFGWWQMQHLDIRQKPNWFGRSIDTTQMHLVKIIGAPGEKEKTWRMQVEVVKTLRRDGAVQATGDAFVNVYKSDSAFNIGPGDLVLIPGRWQPIANAGNPFEFDYARFCNRRQLYHQQLVAANEISVFKQVRHPDQSLLARMHAYCQHCLDTYLKDPAAKGLMQAMLLGDESSFEPGLRQAYADTGVIHIVSISGSHVAVLFLIVTSLLFWLKGRAGQWIKYLAGLLIIWIYVLMAGAPPSAVRSAFMFSVIAAGTMLAKHPHPLNTLLGAAFILLAGNPMWLFAVGFQLSFCAVLSLSIFYRPIYKAWTWPLNTWIGGWLWRAVSASIAAELLIAPLGIFYFHNFPLFFFLANIPAALLLGTLALSGGIALIAFGKIAPLANAIAYCITWLVKIFNSAIVYLQKCNPTSFRFLQLTVWELLLFFALITAFAIALMRRKNRAFLVGVCIGTVLVSLLIMDKYRVLHQQRMVAYNLGKHSRVELICGAHFTPLFTDTGAKDSYVLHGAHIGFQTWKPSGAGSSNVFFQFKTKRILQLRDEIGIDTASAFPVDILLVERSLKGLSPKQIATAFQPKQVVVASGQSRWLMARWAEECAKLHLPFHAVTVNGAFVLE